MLVWDTVLNRFAEFGSNQEIGILYSIEKSEKGVTSPECFYSGLM